MSTKEQLSLFAEDSPASRSLSPGTVEAQKMTAHSGRKCCESYAKYSQLGSLVKTLLESSTWNSTACYLTWKPKVTPHKRLYFQLAPLMPSTEEIESGSLHTMNSGWWPTPSASQGGAGEFIENLITKDGDLAKPGERAYNPNTGKHSQITLQRAVKMWPTPTQHGNNNRQGISKKAGDGLATAVRRESLSGSLNPTWVEWLMGFPIGHTDLNHSETQSFRKSLSKSGKR